MTIKDEIKAEDSPLVAQKPFNESFGLFSINNNKHPVELEN